MWLPTGQAGASLDLVVGWSDGPPATLYPIPSPGLCAWQMPTWMDSRGCPSHHWAMQKAAIWSIPEETQQIIFCYHSFIHKCTIGYLCIPIGIWTIFFCLKTCHWLHPCEIVERSIKYFRQLDTRYPPKLYIHSRRSGRTMFGPSLAVTTTPRTRVGTQDRWRHLVRGSRCRGAKEGRRARSPCPGQEPATNNTRLGQFHFFENLTYMWIFVANIMI